LPNHNLSHGTALLNDAGRIDCFNECLRRPVATWHLSRVNPNFAVVDAHAGQRGEYVLHHFDADAV